MRSCDTCDYHAESVSTPRGCPCAVCIDGNRWEPHPCFTRLEWLRNLPGRGLFIDRVGDTLLTTLGVDCNQDTETFHDRLREAVRGEA